MAANRPPEPWVLPGEPERHELLERLAATFDDPATAGLDWDAMTGSWNGPVDAANLVRAERLRDE